MTQSIKAQAWDAVAEKNQIIATKDQIIEDLRDTILEIRRVSEHARRQTKVIDLQAALECVYSNTTDHDF